METVAVNNINKEYTGEQLRELRTRYAYSQKELANLLGIDNSYVSKIEKGLAPITDTIVDRIVTAFDLGL